MQNQAEPERAVSTRWVEVVVALLIVVGGVVMITDSYRLGASWAEDGPQAGYVPHLIGWSLVLSGLWIAGSAVWRWKKLAGTTFVTHARLKPVFTMLLPTIAYVVLIKWIGLYVASAIYIGAFMIFQGKYNMLPALAVAFGVPIAVFLLFEVWFLVPLPKGPVEHWLGY
jgi:putative tricarboxylic transport membrane protein